MSKQPTCPHGVIACELDASRQNAILNAVFDAVKEYVDDEGITLCPICLRDILLDAAAHMHLTVGKLYAATTGNTAVDGKKVYTAFCSAAFERMEASISADVNTGELTIEYRQ